MITRKRLYLLIVFVTVITVLYYLDGEKHIDIVQINTKIKNYFVAASKDDEPIQLDLCTTEWRNESRRKSRNVLSFTLYGSWANSPGWQLRIPLLAREANASRLYHDWTMRVYHDDTLPVKVRQRFLSQHKNLIFCDINRIPGYANGTFGDMFGMEWRFLPFGDQTVDAACSRDIDSPLTEREFAAVSQWRTSGKYFHLMRDHPQHGSPVILGGLFCFNSNINRNRSNLIYKSLVRFHHKKTDGKKEIDQFFLRDRVWPYLKNDVMQHDAWHCRDKWLKRHGGFTAFTYPREKSTSLFMGCKRPCNTRTLPTCPVQCRPADHQDWINC